MTVCCKDSMCRCHINLSNNKGHCVNCLEVRYESMGYTGEKSYDGTIIISKITSDKTFENADT